MLDDRADVERWRAGHPHSCGPVRAHTYGDFGQDVVVMSVAEVLDQLVLATGDLLGDIQDLSETSARAPSRLPGWSRGHVLTHLARNAEGGAACSVGPGPARPVTSMKASRHEQLL